jgi:hypothetical protein
VEVAEVAIQEELLQLAVQVAEEVGVILVLLELLDKEKEEEIIQVEVELEAVVKMALEVTNHQVQMQMVEQDYKVILMEIIIIMLAEAEEVLGQVGLLVMEELEAEEVAMVPLDLPVDQVVVLPEILVVPVKLYQTME